ncbi:MAG TPA: hypothetical protein VEX70_15925 [Pyrinomonadaceae bacterium]|nr:hypothetical protein [Pyrinomonadaceae bacterium]
MKPTRKKRGTITFKAICTFEDKERVVAGLVEIMQKEKTDTPASEKESEKDTGAAVRREK